jgi:hypothetical protein
MTNHVSIFAMKPDHGCEIWHSLRPNPLFDRAAQQQQQPELKACNAAHNAGLPRAAVLDPGAAGPSLAAKQHYPLLLGSLRDTVPQCSCPQECRAGIILILGCHWAQVSLPADRSRSAAFEPQP